MNTDKDFLLAKVDIFAINVGVKREVNFGI